MSSDTPGADTYPDLAQRLVQAFLRGGKIKPVLPGGHREGIITTLTRLLVNRGLMDHYLRTLEAGRRRHGIHGLLLDWDSSELPIDEIAAEGLVVLSDDQLAELAIDPISLCCLYEVLHELFDADECGSPWWDAVCREGQYELASRGRADLPEQIVRQFEAAETAGQGASGLQTPPPNALTSAPPNIGSGPVPVQTSDGNRPVSVLHFVTATTASEPELRAAASLAAPVESEFVLSTASTGGDPMWLRGFPNPRPGLTSLRFEGSAPEGTVSLTVDGRSVGLVEPFDADGYAVVRTEELGPVLRGEAPLVMTVQPRGGA